jgi:PAS domain S-box-containing protein
VQVEVTNEAYQALENSEKKFRRLYESDLIGIFFSDMNTVWDANDAFLSMIGYSRDDLEKGSISWQKITPPEWASSDKKWIDELLVRGSCTPFEKEYIHKNGSRVTILNGAALLETDPPSWISFTLDVTERKKMTALIEESLAEKEILLKEIHHRVKNNMQVISSLLFLQSQMAKDESVQMLFKESQNRIRSISLVHEQLYQSHNLSTIEYGAYLKKMFIPLFESFKVDVRRVTITIEVPTVMISIDKAVPCSLIVNELLSNSLKHAFPEGKSGKITIDFSLNPETGMYLLEYHDNGVGIPQDLDLKNTGTLGMSLLFGLTRQLSGTITRLEGEGTHFMIVFPSGPIKK